MYSTFLGGLSNDQGHGLALSSSTGRAYVTGATTSVDFPVSPYAYDTIYNVSGDAFVAAIDWYCNSQADRDEDSLLDGWEQCGYSDPEGGFVDLPTMGARLGHKDAFVEVDHFLFDTPCGSCRKDFTPQEDALTLVRNAFFVAPQNNPDGLPGVVLHVDSGKDGIMDPTVFPPAQWGDLSRATTIGTTDPYVQTACNDWARFDGFKADYFDRERQPIFHYAIYGVLMAPDCLGTRGKARTIPGQDFIITIPVVPQIPDEGSTFMHEFGHDLSLHHSGDTEDYGLETNYLSVMNYAFLYSWSPYGLV
jgi:hypothetical protein